MTGQLGACRCAVLRCCRGESEDMTNQEEDHIRRAIQEPPEESQRSLGALLAGDANAVITGVVTGVTTAVATAAAARGVIKPPPPPPPSQGSSGGPASG